MTAPTLLEALSAGTPQACADRLIELALRGGGPDNVTCIVADVVESSEGDDVPIVGGAVVDQAQVTPAAANTPAGRAARMSHPEPDAPVTLSGRRSRRRLVLTLLGVFLLLAAAVSGYAWTQKQYFVGKDGNEVAVFRGVNAHFGPVSLYSVIENSDLKMSDLTQSAASQVLNGITANSRGDAQAIVARLKDQLKPLCSSQTTSPSASASPSPSPSRSVTGHPTGKVSPSRAPSPTLPTGPTVSTSPLPPVDCR